MSRFSARTHDGHMVAYGLDHALGWFYQEFDENGECVSDLDSAFTGLSKGRLVHLLSETDANPARVRAIALDLDPAQVFVVKGDPDAS